MPSVGRCSRRLAVLSARVGEPVGCFQRSCIPMWITAACIHRVIHRACSPMLLAIELDSVRDALSFKRRCDTATAHAPPRIPMQRDASTVGDARLPHDHLHHCSFERRCEQHNASSTMSSLNPRHRIAHASTQYAFDFRRMSERDESCGAARDSNRAWGLLAHHAHHKS